MYSTVAPYFAKPEGRGYTWHEGFTDDYIGYVSYVKEGMYGAITFSVRSLPKPQPATTAQLLYIVTGKIGSLLNLTAPVAYHAARTVLGLAFWLAMYLFIRSVTGSRRKAIAVSFMASLSAAAGWFSIVNGQLTYRTFATFGFTENTALRFASRPHYLFGAFLFLVITMLLSGRSRNRRTVIAVCVLSVVLGTVHPSFATLLAAVTGIMGIITWLKNKRVLTPYIPALLGLGLGLSLSYWSTHQYPYTWILSFEEYVRNEVLSSGTIRGDIISFGPMLWLGLPGLIIRVLRRGRKEADIFLLVWLVVQLLFFFHFYRYLRTERVRYIQSLYFIPMAYGTYVLLADAAVRLGKRILPAGLIILSALTLPTLYQGFKTSLYRHTDYSNFNQFVFPTRAQLEAYAWLDRNTPVESTVTASYEALNHIIIYSHNYVVGNKQGWPYWEGEAMEKEKDRFLTGAMAADEARAYVRVKDIRYVYNGYQEPDGFTSYPFLRKVFGNDEVTVYEIIP